MSGKHTAGKYRPIKNDHLGLITTLYVAGCCAVGGGLGWAAQEPNTHVLLGDQASAPISALSITASMSADQTRLLIKPATATRPTPGHSVPWSSASVPGNPPQTQQTSLPPLQSQADRIPSDEQQPADAGTTPAPPIDADPTSAALDATPPSQPSTPPSYSTQPPPVTSTTSEPAAEPTSTPPTPTDNGNTPPADTQTTTTTTTTPPTEDHDEGTPTPTTTPTTTPTDPNASNTPTSSPTRHDCNHHGKGKPKHCQH